MDTITPKPRRRRRRKPPTRNTRRDIVLAILLLVGITVVGAMIVPSTAPILDKMLPVLGFIVGHYFPRQP